MACHEVSLAPLSALHLSLSTRLERRAQEQQDDNLGAVNCGITHTCSTLIHKFIAISVFFKKKLLLIISFWRQKWSNDLLKIVVIDDPWNGAGGLLKIWSASKILFFWKRKIMQFKVIILVFFWDKVVPDIFAKMTLRRMQRSLLLRFGMRFVCSFCSPPGEPVAKKIRILPIYKVALTGCVIGKRYFACYVCLLEISIFYWPVCVKVVGFAPLLMPFWNFNFLVIKIRLTD